jgi:hypothetical protein
MRRLHRFAFTAARPHVTFDPSRPMMAAPQPQGDTTMTKPKDSAAPRPLSIEEMRSVAGGYTLICIIGKNNQLTCR